MQALYNYFEKWTQVEDVKSFTVEVEKLPGGTYMFTLTPINLETNLDTSLKFALTRSGLTPMDNRKQYNS